MYYALYRSVVEQGNFILEDMEYKIEKAYIEGKLTEEERNSLIALADETVKEERQIDVVAKLAELEERIAVIESAGVVTWKSGMSVSKGQTVLYDILKEGQMRYCRYDGGRTATTLSPGKIDGWVILASAGGEVTHTVSKDESGNIILVPVSGT